MKKSSITIVALSITVVILLSIILTFQNNNENSDEEINTAEGPEIVFMAPMGDEVPVEAPITIQFDKDMNRTSIENAFQISPYKFGSFTWDERSKFAGKIVKYVPMGNLRNGTQYNITLNGLVRDINGNNLTAGTFQFNFTTAGERDDYRQIGNGTEDFWIEHPGTSKKVEHPDWATEAAQTGVVMILSHSEGCSPCIRQMDICESIMENNSGNVVYLDLLTRFDSPNATQIFSNYSPNGYWAIPLTIIITEGLDSNGNDVLLWHSWLGVVDDEILVSWLEDAIIYHEEYIGG